MKRTTNIRKIFMDSVRLYFAPLTGAIKGVRSEALRISRQQHKETNHGAQHS